MRRQDRFIQRIHASAQAVVPNEPVEAVGLLGTVGATRSSQLLFVNMIYALIIRRRGRRRAPGFPLLSALVITPRRLTFVVYRPRYRLGRRVVEMDRRAVQLCVEERGPNRWDLPRLVIRKADNTTLELELRQAGPFAALNEHMLSQLAIRDNNPSSSHRPRLPPPNQMRTILR